MLLFVLQQVVAVWINRKIYRWLDSHIPEPASDELAKRDGVVLPVWLTEGYPRLHIQSWRLSGAYYLAPSANRMMRTVCSMVSRSNTKLLFLT